jgi:zinc transport system substrate-binding protein
VLHDADLVVWIGAGIEKFLEKPLTTVNDKTRQLRLTEVTGLTLLKVRQGGAWEPHSRFDSESHGEEHDHDTPFDQHLWLSPRNATVIVKAIAKTLSQIDTHHASRYHENVSRLTQQLDQLDQELTDQLAPAKQIPFLVFHDAYQYFELRYGLTAVGAVTLSPDQSPSIKRLSELRTRLKELQVRCVFSEPQFEPALVSTIIEGTATRRGTLDPLGAELQAGVEAYFILLRNLAKSFQECLLAK